MLTPGQFEILSYLRSCPDQTAPHSDLASRSDPDGALRVAHLVSLGFAHRSHYYDTVRLTPRGLAAIEQYQSALEREREQDAKKDEYARADALQHEKDKKQAFRNNLIVAVISSLVTLAVEHCMELIDFLGKLIHWVASLFH